MSIARSIRVPASRLLALAAGVVCSVVCSQAALAAPVVGGAYEPFDYADGTELVIGNNLMGGAGWNASGDVNSPNDASTRWALNGTALPNSAGSGPAKRVFVPGLSYTALGYPAATGGKATIDARIPTTAATGTTNNVSRHMGQLIDSGTTYFSYLTDKNNDTLRTTSLAFFGPGVGTTPPASQAERFSFGQIGTANDANTQTNGNLALFFNNNQPTGVVQAANPIAYGVDVTHLVIGKIEWNATGNETVTIWVDPLSVLSEAAAGTPYVSSNGFELTSINSIRLFSGNQANATANMPIKPPVSADFDEIRFGDSWNAAITTNVVPEPATLLLPIVGAALLATRRRKV
jgi:hypothetical protein